MPFAPIPQAITALKAGKMIVLVDDEDRENEGDLVCAAEFITPEMVNFMLKEARGGLCVAMTPQECDRLPPSPPPPPSPTPVDGPPRFGIPTGVPAPERAPTTKLLIKPESTPADLTRPGH